MSSAIRNWSSQGGSQEMSHNLTRKFFQNPHTWPTNPQQHRVWNLKSSGKRRSNSGCSGIYSSIEMWTYWLDNKDAEDGILGTCSIQSPLQAKQPEFGSLTFPSGVDPPSGNWWEDGSKIQAFFSTELHSMQGPLPCHCAGYRVMVMVVSRGWRVRFRSRSRRCKCSDNLFPTKHCGSHRIQGTSRTKAKRGPGHSHHPSKSSKAPGSCLTSTKNIRYKSNHTKIYGWIILKSILIQNIHEFARFSQRWYSKNGYHQNALKDEIFTIPDFLGSLAPGCARDLGVVIETAWSSDELWSSDVHMGVSKNNGTPKSSILIGFSIINHPFWWKKNIAHTHSWKKMHHCLQKCRLSGVWRTIMFISQLQDWFDLITFLIRFQLKEVCEYASNWYQVYIYIYTKCQADLSFPKSVKDSRHIDETRVQHEQFYGLSILLLLLPFFFNLWNKIRSTVPLAFLNANLPMVF